MPAREIESRPSAASHPAARLSLFYAAAFMVTGAQLPFWPVWLAARGLDAGQIAAIFAAAIWAKVILTPALGTLADRVGRRRMMVTLAAIALAADLSLWPMRGFWPVLLINLVALGAQSALMPLGDAITLARARSAAGTPIGSWRCCPPPGSAGRSGCGMPSPIDRPPAAAHRIAQRG
ncbi:MAG TPA: MFS transporter [Stellaceae bacterium]|nr:MFS transporter [Stellaceae bacterium]